MNGEFKWCAFDPNRWDHYYAAGQQVRFYRQSPCYLGGEAIIDATPKRHCVLVQMVCDFFWRILK